MTGLLLTALLSLQAVDLGTSCVAFARGYGERNPFVPSSCGLAIAEVGAVDTAGIWFVQQRIATPWKRRLIYGLAAVAMVHPVLHNIRELRR